MVDSVGGVKIKMAKKDSLILDNQHTNCSIKNVLDSSETYRSFIR